MNSPDPFQYRGDTLWGERWRPVHRRDGLCTRCDGQRDAASSYCAICRQEYQRRYRQRKAKVVA